MILGLDHVGIATADPAGVGAFLTALGLHHNDSGLAEAYAVSCDFWHHRSEPVAVELVAPTGPDSAVGDRLARQGPGLYHLAFRVDDLEADLARLRGTGFVPVDAEPCAGARPGMRVAFLYAPKPAALLVELVHYGQGPPEITA